MQSVFEKNTAEANTKMEKNMKDLHAQMAEMPEQMKQVREDDDNDDDDNHNVVGYSSLSA